MSSAPVVSITDELVAELEALAGKATGGEWEYHLGAVRTMPDADGYVLVAVSPNVPKNWRGQRDTNMRYIATCKPDVLLALLSERAEMQQQLRAAMISVDSCELFRRDAERLDKLDKICEAYGFEGVHEGNRWMIEGPFRDIRAAIDDMKD